jgi:hypothetical protein
MELGENRKRAVFDAPRWEVRMNWQNVRFLCAEHCVAGDF